MTMIFEFFAKVFKAKGTDGKVHDVLYPIGKADLEKKKYDSVAKRIGEEAEKFNTDIVGLYKNERIPYENEISLSKSTIGFNQTIIKL